MFNASRCSQLVGRSKQAVTGQFTGQVRYAPGPLAELGPLTRTKQVHVASCSWHKRVRGRQCRAGAAAAGAGADGESAAGGDPAGASGPTSPAPSTSSSYDEAVLELARSYQRVQHPALSNVRYSIAVADFIEQAVLAYECGYAEPDVAAALGRLAAEGRLAGLQDFDAAECVSLVAVVWVTLALSPMTVKRWATVAAVSEPTFASWRGFVAMIVNGYFERRMAWYPLDRLQLELSAVQGRSLPQEVVAEHARIVFTTLEKVYPQFAAD
ncbi:hypothetical protein CHLRE_02g141850v5 [Chlamydomonas reinhardtii]|uniref:DUF7876 domain-containing protein n=1 Tax=Chlamydomonas reinhardtii TaxID=3055 RepID=A0A2K3E445_CHLRE|nr:uncharacterized protein CHLRE_02g141850v5 [Chlamydomonas reinhardtii]PNW87549.1 hypothetical protein CHLRE_02g141850v5 [Chlamydomonas reinhardtii]